MELLLQVKNLNTGFHTKDGYVPAVTSVNFDIYKGESVALVGESGCGKSVTALSVLRLLSVPPAEIVADSIKLGELELSTLTDAEMRGIRGNDISMIFQEPMTSLNPLLSVGFQVAEAIRLHLGFKKEEANEYAIEMLNKVGISDAARRAKEYPFQLSGGMNQRVMIAIALACNPRLLIADEPTTALDVTIQAQILELIRELQLDSKMAMLLITHNMGIVSEIAERVMVMYAGQIIESCPVETLFAHPWHPYIHGLLTSIPSVHKKVPILNVIKGTVPSPLFFPKGCRFCPRCEFAQGKCITEAPGLVEVANKHKVRCHYPLSDERGVIYER